jgi:hypothetical protein
VGYSNILPFGGLFTGIDANKWTEMNKIPPWFSLHLLLASKGRDTFGAKMQPSLVYGYYNSTRAER